MAFAMLLIGSGLVVNVADTVPRYDMKPTCRAAVAMMGNQGRTVESCMLGEERARKDLEKDWSKYPSAERTHVLRPWPIIDRRVMSNSSSVSKRWEIPSSTGMKNRQPLSRKNQRASLEPPWNCWGRCAGKLERAADKVELTGKQWRRVDGGAY